MVVAIGCSGPSSASIPSSVCGQEFEQLCSREGLPEDRVYFEDRDGRAASIHKLSLKETENRRSVGTQW
jgi:hypothetical protein